MSQQQKCDGIQKPVRWYNGCNQSVPAALRYLSKHPRPIGGSSEYNSEHLLQLADEIERMASKPLFDEPKPLPDTVSAGKFRALVEHCKRADKRLAELTSQLNAVRLYEQKEVWYWQGDGEDHLGSLVCPVVINAEDLRELLRKAVAAVAPDPERATLATDVEPVRADASNDRSIARLAAEKAPEGATHCGPAMPALSPIFLRMVGGLITDVWVAGKNWNMVGPHYTFDDQYQPSIYHNLIPLPCDGNHGGPRCADPECWTDVVDASFPAQANGASLPPVGVVCEVVDDGSLVYGHGESGPVVAHVENCAVVRMSYGLGCFTASYLRPVRTPEQIAAAEERIKAAQEWLKGIEREYGVEAADKCENILLAAETKRVAQ